MRWQETVRWWGATPEERQRRYPCDAVLPEHDEAYYRAVSIRAGASAVFPWLCQLRVAPYSYDWIDNFGRRSPRARTPALENLQAGQPFMSIFELVDFERDVQITLRLRRTGPFPPLAVSYTLSPQSQAECRLVAKIIVQLRPGLRGGLVRRIGPTLDWIMMRRQLLNLKGLAEDDQRKA